MNPLIAAFGFLTRLPMPSFALSRDDFARAIRFYPFAGLVIGALVAGGGYAAALLDPWLGALAALVLWVAVTGALHLDGLGDVADGLGAAHGDRERLLSVMAEPHVGSFAVVAIMLQLVAKLVLLHLLLPYNWLAVLAIPAAARLGPMIWAKWLAPLRPGGLGASLAGIVRARDLIGWGAVLAGAAMFVPALAAAPMLIFFILWWLKAKLGGVTGDAHGAGIELVETGLLVAAVIVSRL